MTWAAVGLGSNLGDRRRHLHDAVVALGALGDVLAVSAIYETAPIGGPKQGPFCNAVAVLDTQLEPRELLDRLLDIETAMGRTRDVTHGPRTIDLDLLLFDDLEIDDPGLVVPHPRLLARRFALYPLLTVWPRPEAPDGTRFADAASAVRDQDLTAITGGYDRAAADWR